MTACDCALTNNGAHEPWCAAMPPYARDTPEAALAAALEEIDDYSASSEFPWPDTQMHAAAILTALPKWRLVPVELCKAPAGTYDGIEGGRPQCPVPCPHSLGGPSEPHKPGDPHQYKVECHICGERGYLHVSWEPQVAT